MVTVEGAAMTTGQLSRDVDKESGRVTTHGAFYSPV